MEPGANELSLKSASINSGDSKSRLNSSLLQRTTSFFLKVAARDVFSDSVGKIDGKRIVVHLPDLDMKNRLVMHRLGHAMAVFGGELAFDFGAEWPHRNGAVIIFQEPFEPFQLGVGERFHDKWLMGPFVIILIERVF